MLFYAVGGAPYHSHLTASVHNGTVKVSMAFGEEDINILAGTGASDYRYKMRLLSIAVIFSYKSTPDNNNIHLHGQNVL